MTEFDTPPNLCKNSSFCKKKLLCPKIDVIGYNDSKKLTTSHEVNDFRHGGCHLRQKKVTEASFTCCLAIKTCDKKIIKKKPVTVQQGII